MIHGPCGAANPLSPCMENGRCTKGFPKQFQPITTMDTDNSYPVYRRRHPADGGRNITNPTTGRQIDNSWVVPYSPFLSLRYNCHINVEVCVSPTAAKYLYKYVTKGPDRAMVSEEVDGQQVAAPTDEIQQYEDLRSVGSSEATWHLMAFPIAKKHPAVYALRIHLEEEQQVVFNEGDEENALERQRNTELTAFFQFNKTTTDKHMYVDMPKYCTYNYNKETAKKVWKVRRVSRGTIGRVHTVHPLAGEVFYLRMLLHNDHCRGKEGFTDMLTLPNGHVCDTYQEVCRQLGLLIDDREWEVVLEDAVDSVLSPQIRALFVTILLFCQPADPRSLFDRFYQSWTDDFHHKARRRGLTLQDEQAKTLVLLDLQLRLQSFERSLLYYRLPEPTKEEVSNVQLFTSTDAAVIREETYFDVPQLQIRVNQITQQFTESQQGVFDTIMTAVKEDTQLHLIVDARGGCGKTFVLNAVLDAVRSLEPGGCVALAMATTGIAANLLNMGRTFHSRMKAPLTPTENSTLQISAQSSLAQLVCMAKVLLVDEATMLHRHNLEAMDRTLRDLMRKPDQVFGGNIVILAGDFRQCLPVVPGASRAGTVNACINQSTLWHHFQVVKMMENMRVRASGDPQLEAFDMWTLSLGDGTATYLPPQLAEQVAIPAEMVTTITPNTREENGHEHQSMINFCNIIFPDLAQNITDHKWLEGRAILTPTNREVHAINELMKSKMPGDAIKLSSADSLEDPDDTFRFNIEYLNTLRPNGFPRHNIILKPGMPLMLLRNTNPREGLCNGTRMIFDTTINNKLLRCTIAGTTKQVLIPRITFRPKD